MRFEDMKDMTPRERAQEIAKETGCCCDLDNWQPTRITGHSHVCRIHKMALGETPIQPGRPRV